MRRTTPPQEGATVLLDGHAIELDRPIDGRMGQGDQAFLPGRAEQEHVGGDRVAHQRGRQTQRLHRQPALTEDRSEASGQPVGIRVPVRVAGKLGGRDHVGANHAATAGLELGDGFIASRDDQVAADQRIAFTIGHAGGMQHRRFRCEFHMREHRAVFLRQTGHIEVGAVQALEVRRHRQRLANGDHAGAADPGHQQAEGPGRSVDLRFGQLREHRVALCNCPCPRVDRVLRGCGRRGLAQLAASDGDKARAKAFGAGEVLVAARLIDLALAPETSFERLDRHAAGDGAAIAAALADRAVDEGALVRIGPFAALAQPSALGGAGLVVQDHGHIGEFAEIALHRIELGAMVNLDDRCQRNTFPLARIIADQRDLLHALGGEFTQDAGNRQLAVDRLAAGHRDEAVVQDLVGDRHMSGDRLTQREKA